MDDQPGDCSHVRHLLVDRDGVLNQEAPGQLVCRREDWRWEQGVHRAMSLLAQHGILVSIVTNQSAVSRGELDEHDLRILHDWVTSELRRSGVSVVGVFYCPHGRNARCSCRKPAPGLLLDAIAASGIDIASTVLVGDDLRDLEAAAAVGVRSVLVRTGKGAAAEVEAKWGMTVVDDLHSAVRLLIDA